MNEDQKINRRFLFLENKTILRLINCFIKDGNYRLLLSAS